MDSSTSVQAVGAAMRDVEAAEVELQRVLSEVAVVSRAEKIAVSIPLQEALKRLREVRSSLREAEELLLKLEATL